MSDVKDTILKVVLSTIAIILGLFSIFACVVAPWLFMSNGVASADSSDGVVEDNLLLNNDFSNFDNLFVNYSGTIVDSYSPLRFHSHGTWGYVCERHNIDYFDLTKSITFTVRVRAVNSQTIYIGARTYNSAGSSITSLSTRSTASSSFVNLSVTYNLSTLGSDVAMLGFAYYCNGSSDRDAYCEVEWAKVEYGTSFTGYVPKDYSNYGYNQGVDDMAEKNYDDLFTNMTGYALLGSLDYNLGIKTSDIEGGVTHEFSSINNGIIFSYAGVDYYESYSYGGINSSGRMTINIQYTAPSDSDMRGCAKLCSNVGGRFYMPFIPSDAEQFYLLLRYSDGSCDLTEIYVTEYINNYATFSYNPRANCDIYICNKTIERSTAGLAPTICIYQLHCYSYYRGYVPTGIYANLGDNAFFTQNVYTNGYNKGVDDTTYYYESILETEKDNAWQSGKSYGIAHANEYTFTGLISSIVDAPIKALFGTTYEEDVYDQNGNLQYAKGVRYGGLFNMTILGTDLTAFFTAMISLALMITIIRIAIKVAS